MKLDINELNHQYIKKMVIFAIFLYRGQIRQTNIYKMSVMSFLKKRLPWKINLDIDTGIKLNKGEEREIFLDELLHGIESDYMSIITVTFTTAVKTTVLEIDLKNEEKYEQYVYS